MEGQFTEMQRQELLRLVRGLKAATLASIALDAPLETLRALADQTEALAAALAPFTGTRPFPSYSSSPTDLPWSPVSGPFSPVAPDVEFSVEGDEQKRVVGRVRFSSVFEGPPTYVHGGCIAAMFDQVLAYANRANGVGALTGSLTVRYRKPTPTDTDLVFEAWTDRVEGQKVFARGECRAGATLLTEAEGVFVRLDPERARRVFGGR